MAEGWVNYLLAEHWEARSAGTEPAPSFHPLAVQVMGEEGIDLSNARPTPVKGYLSQAGDLVVTVCDSARERCPVFPGSVSRLHVGLEDPAAAEGLIEDRIAAFRRGQDPIRRRLIPQLVDWQ